MSTLPRILKDNGGSMDEAVKKAEAIRASKKKWITAVMTDLLVNVDNINYMCIVIKRTDGLAELKTPVQDMELLQALLASAYQACEPDAVGVVSTNEKVDENVN